MKAYIRRHRVSLKEYFISNTPLSTHCLLFAAHFTDLGRMELGSHAQSRLPALGIEPRPSRVRGGDRNNSATQTDCNFIAEDNWSKKIDLKSSAQIAERAFDRDSRLSRYDIVQRDE